MGRFSLTIMGVLITSVLGSSLPSETGAAEQTVREYRQRLLEALDTVEKRQAPNAARTLCKALSDVERVSDAEWRKLFLEYAKDGLFTPGLEQFWNFAVEQAVSPSSNLRVVYLSGLNAGAVLGRHIEAGAGLDNVDSASRSLKWLESIGPRLGADVRRRVVETIQVSAAGGPVDLGDMISVDPPHAWVAFQSFLTVANYSSADVGRVLKLPGPLAGFMRTTGILLCDNGTLGPAHLVGLESLIKSVPVGLHAVSVIVVSNALGRGFAPLLTPGQVMPIEAIPMNVMSNPNEFIPRIGLQAAPEFTLRAACQLVRAIQEIQFTRRPALVMRRNGILFRAEHREERYLRRFVPPAVYLQNSNELLPQTGYLWFLNTEKTFRSAMELLEVWQREPMDTFLLLADLLSGGSDTTIVCHTRPDGIVSSGIVPVGRTHIDRLRVQAGAEVVTDRYVSVNADYVTAIGIGGSFWMFDLNEVGSVSRAYRR